jgi:hypothetical protein
MRLAGLGVCLIALACGSCSGGLANSDNIVERGGALQANQGAYGRPAGYYPGRGEPFGGNSSEYRAWVAKNQAGIAEIQSRIAEIGEGARPPGCIGEDKYACIASLAQRLTLADEFFLKDSNVFADAKYDVNGRPLTGKHIMIEAYAPNAKLNHLDGAIFHHTTLFLSLGPGGKVTKLEADLGRDPMLARTQDEYDATELYAVLAPVTAKACPTLTGVDIAKWFQNTIKPHARLGARRTFSDADRGHERDVLVWKTTFCGREIAFRTVYGAYFHGFQRNNYGGTAVTIE